MNFQQDPLSLIVGGTDNDGGPTTSEVDVILSPDSSVTSGSVTSENVSFQINSCLKMLNCAISFSSVLDLKLFFFAAF